MVSKSEALERIEEISQAMRQSLSVILPGTMFIAIGVAVAMIPGVEFLLQSFVDPILVGWKVPVSVIFLLRTVFYWGSFALLSGLFRHEAVVHPAIKKAWGLNLLYPLIPVATAGMLALIGHAVLAMPIVLILVGLFYALIGRFTHVALTGLAISYIVVGIGSIYLTTFNIPSLYLYLLLFQGIACMIAGLVMHYSNRQ